MQLSKKSVCSALAVGACALLGTASPSVAGSATWEVDTGVSSYIEADDRIKVVEFSGAAKTSFGDDQTLKLKITVDTITGASPNGATPSSRPQTFTSPSGNTKYDINPGDTPLDPTFRDSRLAASAGWEQGITSMLKGNMGLFASTETDHLSAGLNGGLSLDLNNRNTTLFAGLSYEYGKVSPVGGTPRAMMTTGPGVEKTSTGDSESLGIADALAGITQTLSRRLLTQLNYSYSQSGGYLTNPYKVLSAVDATTGETIDYVFERRPDSRTRQSVFWRLKYSFDQDVVDLSYRYMWDDWEINSHTVTLKYFLAAPNRSVLEPYLRFYTQTAAYFHRSSVILADDMPQYASADTRLGKFDAYSVGLKYSTKGWRSSTMGARLEFYAQKGEDHPQDAIGVQKNMDLYPEASALVAQLFFSF